MIYVLATSLLQLYNMISDLFCLCLHLFVSSFAPLFFLLLTHPLFFLVCSKIQVDLLEPVSHFLEAARESLASEGYTNSDMHKAVNFYCVPLQVCAHHLHINDSIFFH